MLAAAGFLMEPADTPERQAQLASLPPHQLLAQPLQVGGNETVGYVYADPDLCHCLYVGDQRAFQAFQQLALQKQIADEHLQAAQMEENAAFDWSMWGPGRGCGYDDGGFGAPVRHFGNPTPWSENPFLNPCWPE